MINLSKRQDVVLKPANQGSVVVLLSKEDYTVDATSFGHWLSRKAILWEHFGQEWNHTISSACKISPVNQAKYFTLLHQCVS